MMNEYDFILKFALPADEVDPETFIEKLFEAGCDDALIGSGSAGRIALHFIRAGESASVAVLSALENVKQAIPDAQLIEAYPDLVGLTDLAKLLGCSRQNMRKMILKEGGNSPIPVHDGNPSLWHLANILDWFMQNGKYEDHTSLYELATTNMTINSCKKPTGIIPEIEKQARLLVA